MRIFPIQADQGRVFVFEVENIMLGRRGLRRLVRRIPGSEIKAFHGFREEFCEFDLDGIRFVALEPFNDNSRYLIAPKEPRWVPQVEVVRRAFEEARPVFGFLVG
jgi:hypothetical protein